MKIEMDHATQRLTIEPFKPQTAAMLAAALDLYAASHERAALRAIEQGTSEAALWHNAARAAARNLSIDLSMA